MFSKKFKLLVILAALGISACTSPLDDPKPATSTINMGSGETQCLSDASVKIKRYFDGTSNAEEIGSFWDCTSKALQLFADNTRGTEVNSYDPKELRNFFEKYFLGKQKISDELLKQGMRLKNAILGGGSERLSKEELRKTRELIAVLKQESIALLKYQPIRPSHIVAEDQKFADTLAVDLLASSERIGAALIKNTSAYDFDDMNILLRELDSFFKASDAEIPEIKGMLDYLPLFRVLKNMMVSRNRDQIVADDWSKLLNLCTKWYGWYLKLNHFNTSNPEKMKWMMGTPLERLRGLMKNAKDMIVESIAIWPNSTVPFSEIDLSINAIGEDRIRAWFSGNDPTCLPDSPSLDQCPVKLKTSTLKGTLRPLIRRIMGGADNSASGREAEGLSAEALERFYRELDRFFEGQSFLDRLFTKAGDSKTWMNDLAGIKYDPDKLAVTSSDIQMQNQLGEEAKHDLLEMISKYRPLFLTADGRVTFQYPTTSDSKHSFYNLFMMNWMHTISRMFVSGFAGYQTQKMIDDFKREHPGRPVPDEDLTRAKSLSGLTIDEVDAIYRELYELGKDLYIFSPKATSKDSGKKRFIEANLFSFESDGGDYLSLNEMTQMLAFLTSAKFLSTKIYDVMAANCERGGHDDYKNWNINAKCVTDTFYDEKSKNYEAFWDHMPSLKEFYSKLGEKDKKSFKDLLENAVRGDHIQSEYYDTDDFDGMATLIHYVEGVFSRYDLNRTNALEKNEAVGPNGAYDVFKSEIEGISGFKSNFLNKNAFTYMLKHGRAPDPKKAKDIVSFGWWLVAHPLYKIKADRLIVFNILSELSKSTGEKLKEE